MTNTSLQKANTLLSEISTKSFNENFKTPLIHSKPCGTVSSFLATFHKMNENDLFDSICCLNDIKLKTSDKVNNPDLATFQISYFGLFEGLSSPSISEYLKENLYKEIISDENFLISTHTAIIRAFEKVAMNLSEKNISCSFSSALVVLFIDNICFIANLGCSRCIMSTFNGNNIYQMTRSQDCDQEQERERIFLLGGEISSVQGKCVVLPENLNCVRVFSSKDVTAKYFNTQPDILNFVVKENADFLIIYNKGIYDYMNNDEMIYSVYNALKRLDIRQKTSIEDTYRGIAKEILGTAFKNGNDEDDMGIIVIFFEQFVKNYINPLQRSMKLENTLNTIALHIKKESYVNRYFDFITNKDNIIRLTTIYDAEMKKKKRKEKEKERERRESDNDKTSQNIMIESIGSPKKKVKKSFCKRVCCCQ